MIIKTAQDAEEYLLELKKTKSWKEIENSFNDIYDKFIDDEENRVGQRNWLVYVFNLAYDNILKKGEIND